jgi:hypothetical protein
VREERGDIVAANILPETRVSLDQEKMDYIRGRKNQENYAEHHRKDKYIRFVI